MTIIYQCGDITLRPTTNEYSKAISARFNKKASSIIASSQAINHTSKGDFTHLAPTGHLTVVIRG